MELIANLLDSAKAKAGIESDYRLSKVIGITHAAISCYRVGKALPGDKVIAQLCALSGDDAQLIYAQVQAFKASSSETQSFWNTLVLRLQSDRRHAVRGVGTAILSVLFSIVLIAGQAREAGATALHDLKSQCVSSLYIVSSTVLTVCHSLHENRLRWSRRLPGFSALRGAFLLFY